MKSVLALAACLGVGGVAHAQFITNFDAYGLGDLNGQDSWYLPAAGGNSLDVVAYAGNPWSIPANPAGGGANFAGGDVVAAGNIFGRSQRDLNWGPGSGVWIVCYDLAWAYVGVLPAANNVASFSFQNPGVAAGVGLNLMSYEDIATAAATQHFYIYYDAANLQHAQPGKDYGAAWNNLAPLNWYRFATVVDFDVRQVICVSITDLSTGASAIAMPPAADPLNLFNPLNPTGFRLFAGGLPGNVTAWDNVAATCYADCEKDGDKDVFDFLCFQNLFAQNSPYADCECDGDWDVFDFLCFQNRFAGCVF